MGNCLQGTEWTHPIDKSIFTLESNKKMRVASMDK